MPTILLAVSGMSPAILTETVWALAREKPRIVPDEVIVLTTTAGARDIETQLLAERKAALPEDAGHFPPKGAPGRPGRFHRP